MLFSGVLRTVSRRDHILGHKSALIQKNEVIPSTFSDHDTMKLEVNHKKKFGKITNTWTVNNVEKKKKISPGLKP